MIKTFSKIAIVFIIGMIGGALSFRLLGFYVVDERPIYLTETREIYITENRALQEAFEKVKGSVVGVRAGAVEGSGLVLTNDGLVVLLNETIPFNQKFSFFVDNGNPSYQVLKRDQGLNLALVKLEANNLPSLGFKRLEDVKRGERVFLSGAVFDEDSFSRAVNEGIVRNINNYVYTNISEGKEMQGSILFSISGEVIGINLVGRDGRVYAIPSNVIREFAGF